MAETYGVRHFSFMPECYVWPEEQSLIEQSASKKAGPWIVKPAGSSQGKGATWHYFVLKIPFPLHFT